MVFERFGQRFLTATVLCYVLFSVLNVFCPPGTGGVVRRLHRFPFTVYIRWQNSQLCLFYVSGKQAVARIWWSVLSTGQKRLRLSAAKRGHIYLDLFLSACDCDFLSGGPFCYVCNNMSILSQLCPPCAVHSALVTHTWKRSDACTLHCNGGVNGTRRIIVLWYHHLVTILSASE